LHKKCIGEEEHRQIGLGQGSFMQILHETSSKVGKLEFRSNVEGSNFRFFAGGSSTDKSASFEEALVALEDAAKRLARLADRVHRVEVV
jgi:hypothetical protein